MVVRLGSSGSKIWQLIFDDSLNLKLSAYPFKLKNVYESIKHVVTYSEITKKYFLYFCPSNFSNLKKKRGTLYCHLRYAP